MDTPISPITDAPRRTLALDGRQVFYDRGGAGFPLLLLHGWGGSARYWQGTIAALGGAHDVIAPDLPGFGASPPLDDSATPERLAAWTIAFADALGLEQFDLNGHSLCAGVAARVAAAQPGRVRRLVLTAFSTYRSEAERRLVDQIHHIMALWMRLRRPWMAERRLFYRAVAGRFFYRLPADDDLLRDSVRDFLRMDRRTALQSAAAAGSPTITPALQGVRAPTLLIGARQDTIMPPAGTPEVARLIPNCQLVWVERCGHLPMIERPDLYHRLLADFLAAP